MGRSRTFAAICLTLALTLSFAPTADAGTKRANIPSSVSLEVVGPDGATGRVQSARKECVSQRRISFYRVNSEQSVPSTELAGATWTGGDGSWSIAPPLYPSEFIAVAEAKKTKRTVCTPATSNSLSWG